MVKSYKFQKFKQMHLKGEIKPLEESSNTHVTFWKFDDNAKKYVFKADFIVLEYRCVALMISLNGCVPFNAWNEHVDYLLSCEL